MRVQQMLPSIFYYYWFQNQVGYQHQELKMNLRNLPVAIDNIEEIEEIVDSAQEQRSEFYRIYTKFLDRVDSADALLEQMNSSAAMEAGLPLLPDQQPFVRSEIDGVEYSFDFKSGILNQIITDTRSKMENAERQYSRLQERYEIVLEELSQQFDLTISKQNRELTESSVELQEEMKGLNESSLQLQKEVGTLNRWVIVLTLILVGQAFGLFSLTVKVAVDIYQYLSIHIM
ncbi:hypothetical protein D3261_17725 [Halococcus sp. IIIV-5B]|nr:hypothetical protein D3261_17725 [Halococcus sp. IIIV-5B]